MKTDIELAAEYSKTIRSDLQGGMVIIYNRDVTGWIRDLNEPHRFRPGCIAVDATGTRWKSTGGDYQNGAARWEPMA